MSNRLLKYQIADLQSHLLNLENELKILTAEKISLKWYAFFEKQLIDRKLDLIKEYIRQYSFAIEILKTVLESNYEHKNY